MSYVEWYETVARLADETSLPPLPGVYPDEQEWTNESRKAMILGHKIEGLVVRLYETCTNGLYKENNPL